MKLVIVESVAKAKKIQGILGGDYIVKASIGHIRNLSNYNMGIDVCNGFKPNFIVLPKQVKTVKSLEELARKSEEVILAGDADREGEAICWHLADVLGLSLDDTKRISFQEITKSAILGALNSPSRVNMDLVYAQRSRCILDKLFGFELSQLLWKHIQPKLSAGRVQSVVLRMVVDRDNEVKNFSESKYFRTVGKFNKVLSGVLEKKYKTDEEVKAFLEGCKGGTYSVLDIVRGKSYKKPSAPYTTPTLLQDASVRYRMSSNQVMKIAQSLYEAGKITYHRTDSVSLSDEILGKIKVMIRDRYGNKYVKVTKYKTNVKCAQEAHEAIRPVDVNEEELGGDFGVGEKKIYNLIWRRTVSSQMPPAEYDTVVVGVGVSSVDGRFVIRGSKMVFDGYMRVYDASAGKDKDKDKDEDLLSDYGAIDVLKVGDILLCNMVESEEKYTGSGGRYSEATLIKRMKDSGVGRPSTYAMMVNTLMERGYVVRDSRGGDKRRVMVYVLKKDIMEKSKDILMGREMNKLFPTDVGVITSNFLVNNFGDMMNSEYTGRMEGDLDAIANGRMVWNDMLRVFYDEFSPKIKSMGEKSVVRERENHVRLVGVDSVSGRNVYTRVGKFGPVIQLGEKGDKDIRYASLEKHMSVDSITLVEALNLLQYPKSLGDYQGEGIVVKKGKYGYYIQWGEKTYSLLGVNVDDVNRTRAIETITMVNPGIKTKYVKR